MNDKITLVELTRLVAEASSTTLRVCDLFLRELFATVSQALIDGESVKIKGIGTFKVSAVKPHASVNAATGESIEIKGYNRLTFTPDKALAEALNQPFAQFETVTLDDAVTDEQLDDIDKQYPSLMAFDNDGLDEENPAAALMAGMPVAPLPEELPAMDGPAPAPEPDMAFVPDAPEAPARTETADKGKETEPAQEEKRAEEPVAEEPVAEEPAAKAPVVEEPVTEAKPDEQPPVVEKTVEEKRVVEEKTVEKKVVEKVAEKKVVEKPAAAPAPVRKPMLVGRPIDGPSQPVHKPQPVEEPVVDDYFYRPAPRNVYTPTEEQILRQRKPDWHRWLRIGLGVLAACALIWLLARGCSSSEKTPALTDSTTVVEADTVATVEQSEAQPEEKPAVKTEEKTEAKSEEKPVEQTVTKPAKKPDVITDKVTSQIVLSTLSEKYYGSPWFWVYIYEENKNIISDPNNVRPGTTVVIPPPEKYGINAKDPASLKKAQRLSWEILKGK